jgi:hypothetical protein
MKLFRAAALLALCLTTAARPTAAFKVLRSSF